MRNLIDFIIILLLLIMVVGLWTHDRNLKNYIKEYKNSKMSIYEQRRQMLWNELYSCD